jgi:hypothetical protein
MNADASTLESPPATTDATATTPGQSLHRDLAAPSLDQVVDGAIRKVAPLWPLKHFVAVNPYLGLIDRDFGEVADLMARTAGARTTAPRAFYAEAIDRGRITREDLDKALAAIGPFGSGPKTVDALIAFAQGEGDDHLAEVEVAPTVGDVAREATGTDWARFAIEAISRWAGSYFDQGQAFWHSPWGDRSPYAAWHAEAQIDRTPELSGLAGFRRVIAGLPGDADRAIEVALERLGVPAEGLDLYLHRLLMTVGGWAAYARYQVWDSELYGGTNPNLSELLAVRLAWEVGILEGLGGASSTVGRAWESRRQALGEDHPPAAASTALAGELALHTAFESAVQRELVGKIHARPAAPEQSANRPKVQAVFCIDVRSEVYRRNLESVDPQVETLGFAGFFGFALQYLPLGEEGGGSQCPVLLTPQFTISETLRGASGAEVAEAVARKDARRVAERVWRGFKFAAVSCFGFVGPVGLAYAKKIVSDLLGKSRPVTHPVDFGLDAESRAARAPELAPGDHGGHATGLSGEQRLALAEGALRAMSMTHDFGRLVLLAGHGSTTVNNPHATGLDCGACGGHTGEANARVAAAVLNDPEVRTGLKGKGIDLPDDTIFLAGQHDTTTDEVTIFDRELVPESHRGDLAELDAVLAEAGKRTRRERARLLRVDTSGPVDGPVLERSRDWSQVRPEWGLAGCAAFIVAPRSRTLGVDLGGRSFLHSYNWQEDDGFGVLELIMTAPMVVASWISLQYYGSTVDNQVFGCGNKTLHNVVGTLGVLEGNAGDLRVGLPWQSLHDGERLIHEPVRLNVMIEAPIDAMNEIIGKHEMVRHLLDNGWLHLFQIDGDGRIAKKYAGGLDWQALGN